MICEHAILTPTSRPGGVAMIRVRTDDPAALGLSAVTPGSMRHTDLLGLDRALILGEDARTCLLMPHGGIALVRRISEELDRRGCPLQTLAHPVVHYPEASSEIDAWCLHALSIAPSPLAVDALLTHNARWAQAGHQTTGDAGSLGRERTPLDRLIHPPTVAAVGRANIGKSSLLNTLVGQRVALVSDHAGTTRDHVGVAVDLGGLVVRWVDTPGVDERIDDAEEIGIAAAVVGSADLVVHCIDPGGPDAAGIDPRLGLGEGAGERVVRVGVRSDLGGHAMPVEARVSTLGEGEGMGRLVALLRERLLPASALSDPTPWRFWTSLTPRA